MIDVPPKTGFYPVIRFHKKSGSQPYLEGAFLTLSLDLDLPPLPKPKKLPMLLLF